MKGKRLTKLAVVVAVGLLLVLGLSSAALASSWSDVPDSMLASYGVTNEQVSAIASGYPDGTFRPNDNIVRTQFVKMADDAFSIEQAFPASPTFSDVPTDDDYYGYIEGAYAAGLVNGIGGGLFGPWLDITREQAIGIIARQVAADEGYDLDAVPEGEISAVLAPFGDAADVSGSLRAEVAYAIVEGITKGNSAGLLAPQDPLIRIAAATLLVRASTGEEVALTVKKGDVIETYSLDELKVMDSLLGYWGSSKGEPPWDTNEYEGVMLSELLEDVGGLDEGDSLVVTASDDFVTTYDADRLALIESGQYPVKDKTTGAESTAAVELILAYEMNGEPLPEAMGLLRLVPATASDQLVSEGKYSPYMVVSIEVVAPEPVALTVSKGELTETYTMSEITAMATASGWWGAHKGELPYTTNEWLGVPVLALLEPVGGLEEGDNLVAIAEDGFITTYDADRLTLVEGGAYPVWDKDTGEEGIAPVQLIMAYEMDGEPLPEAMGLLRLVPITVDDNLVSEGKYSPYLVIELQVQ